MSATCEHVYCRGCIEEHLKGSSTCPCDRSVLEVGKGGAAPAPRLVKLLCDELVVQCSRCQSWTGQRADWARHSRDDCGKVHESCPHECGQTGFTDQGAAKKHQKDECRLRMVECEMCKLAVRHETLEVRDSLMKPIKPIMLITCTNVCRVMSINAQRLLSTVRIASFPILHASAFPHTLPMNVQRRPFRVLTPASDAPGAESSGF